MGTFLSLPGTEHHESRIFMKAVAMSYGVVLFGTGGFILIEPGWTVWRVLYFTLITTGGFGDERISETGQKSRSPLSCNWNQNGHPAPDNGRPVRSELSI